MIEDLGAASCKGEKLNIAVKKLRYRLHALEHFLGYQPWVGKKILQHVPRKLNTHALAKKTDSRNGAEDSGGAALRALPHVPSCGRHPAVACRLAALARLQRRRLEKE